MADLFEGMSQEEVEGLLAKLVGAASAEDVARIAAEEGVGLSAQQAATLYGRLCADVELSDDESAVPVGGIGLFGGCDDCGLHGKCGPYAWCEGYN